MSIEVKNGCFRYDKGPLILSDVSLRAEDGEIVAVLGPNGAGKTTLLKCALGLLPFSLGKSFINGEDIRKIKGRRLWQKVAYVPQMREHTFAYNTEDMVLLGRSPYLGSFQVPGKNDMEKAERAMELAGVSHLIGKSCKEISGGEMQLVLIARALSAEPGHIVLDEPESGLDLKNQFTVLELLKKLSRVEGMTVVLNTHYPEHAVRIADKAMLLFKDSSHVFGKTEEVLTEESLSSAFGIDIAMNAGQIRGKDYTSVIPLG